KTEAAGWDGVAGNPPYIRFGNWASDQREPALDLMRREGLRPNRLTNAWVPFVVASTVLVRDGGRVGLVLPAELLQVGYAAQLRELLLRRFGEITLLTFERLVFDGILQEVVLFCGVVGAGPARIRTVHLGDADARARACLAGQKGEGDKVLPGPRRDPAAANAQAVAGHDPARVRRRRGRGHRDGP